MAHLYKKVKNGRDYYYIRETQRVYGKPTTINQVYLGTADKVESLLKGDLRRGFSPKEFGSVFLLNELNRLVDMPGIVDDILPPKKRTKGPSLGELLFYAAMNRAIAPTSKRQLATWFESTDIQRIRPLRLESLNSQNFWNYFDRIGDTDLERMVVAFFKQVHSLLPAHEEHLVLEANNIYSNPKASAEAAAASESQEDLFHQPRVGLAVISERFCGIPVYFQTFPGGLPDNGFFPRHVDSILHRLPALGITAKDLTIIFSQGIDSQAQVDKIDAQEKLHFIAAYSPDLEPEMAKIPLKEFRPLPCKANDQRLEAGEEENQILYHETQASLWNRPRRVIITYDPKAFQKKYQELRTRVQKLRKEILALQRRYQSGDRQGLDSQYIQAHLLQVSRRLNLNPGLFTVSFTEEDGRPVMNFQLDQAQLNGSVRQFGKQLLITDREDWEAPEICQTYMERCVLDAQPSESKYSTHVTLMPLYHWTESKISVHMFVCVAALTYLALFSHHLAAAGLSISAKEAMNEMRGLRTAIFLAGPDGKLKRALETITDTQQAILKAMGHQVEEGKVAPL